MSSSIGLAIESSCDESSLAVIDSSYQLLALVTESHLACLEPYQGVMPEAVSREHVKHFPRLLDLIKQKIELKNIDFITYTAGPGLAGSLLVGANMAHSLALILNKPLVPVHHIIGHQLAFLLEKPDLLFPCLSLVVSGGHTQLVLLKSPLSYEILGQTRDDAAGEAFDKIAKHIGLGYPGGPALSARAAQGNRHAYNFSIPLASAETLEFSFSGFKTQAMRVWKEGQLSLEDFCAAVEKTIVDTLLLKTKQALARHPNVKSVLVSGGVACNSHLRERFREFSLQKGLILHIPSPKFCSDNAAMIGATGMYYWLNARDSLIPASPLIRPQWSIDSCTLS